LRAAADRYYASMTAAAFKVRRGWGPKGEGDALVLGSSRARYAFAQNILSARLNHRVFKETQAGQFPKFNYFYYRNFRAKMGPPKFVFYGLDYFVFEKKSAPGQVARLGPVVRLETLEPRGAVNEASPLLSRVSWLFRLKPEIDEYAAYIIGLDREDGPEADPDETASTKRETGAMRRAVPPRPVQGPAIARPARWRLRPYRPYPGVEGSYLKALLDDLDKDRVWTFLVIIPDHEGTNAVNYETLKFRRDMEKLAGRYARVRVLDLNTPDKFDLADPAKFWDGGWGISNCHLSVEGRLDFTEKLAVEVNRILRMEGGRRPAGKDAR
jgi:hypothetical protein